MHSPAQMELTAALATVFMIPLFLRIQILRIQNDTTDEYIMTLINALGSRWADSEFAPKRRRFGGARRKGCFNEATN